MTAFFFNSFIELRNVSKKGLFQLLSANGLVFIAGSASQLFVASFLEPIEIGQIKIMQTYIGLASIVGGLGFNVALLKLASDEQISREQKNQYLNISIYMGILSFFIIYIIILIINSKGYTSKDIELRYMFPFFSILLLPLIVQTSYLSYFQAIKQIKKMANTQSLTKIISVITIVLATWRFGIFGYIWAAVISAFISLFVFQVQLKQNIFKNFNFYFNEYNLKTMWSMSSYALAANIIGSIIATIDIYLVNYFIGDRTIVGFYMFALTLVSIYQFFPSSIQQISTPFFANKSKEFKNWLSAYKKYNLLNHILITLITVLGSIFVLLLVPITFNGKYDQSLSYFILISIGWGIRNLNIMKGTALMGMGKFNLNYKSSLITLVISFPMILISIYYFGINGALFSHIIVGIISYLTSDYIFNKYIQENNQTYV